LGVENQPDTANQCPISEVRVASEKLGLGPCPTSKNSVNRKKSVYTVKRKLVKKGQIVKRKGEKKNKNKNKHGGVSLSSVLEKTIWERSP